MSSCVHLHLWRFIKQFGLHQSGYGTWHMLFDITILVHDGGVLPALVNARHRPKALSCASFFVHEDRCYFVTNLQGWRLGCTRQHLEARRGTDTASWRLWWWAVGSRAHSVPLCWWWWCWCLSNAIALLTSEMLPSSSKPHFDPGRVKCKLIHCYTIKLYALLLSKIKARRIQLGALVSVSVPQSYTWS